MNIFDYLKWRGDISFKVDPFNEVDNLVISFLAYTRFENYLDEKKTYSLKEAYELYFSAHHLEDILKEKGFTAKAPLILQAMVESIRFNDCQIRNFVSRFSPSNTEQFCAFELVIDKKTSYLVFRGTDDTIVGWKEDFCLSYTLTMAQKRAAVYLKEVIKNNRRYYVGGHSKGGNLAEYAAVANPKLSKNIIVVYNNDGPGLNTSLLNNNYQESFELLKNKYLKIVPEYDFFGTIYGSDKNLKVIKSSENGILAHDILSWQVLRNQMLAGEIAEDALMFGKAFKDFLESVSKEKKELFVNELFAAMSEAGMQNISDFARGGFEVFFNTLKNFSDMDKDSKEVAGELLKAFLEQYKTKMKQGLKKVINSDEKSS